jgi:hypothetical protein
VVFNPEIPPSPDHGLRYFDSEAHWHDNGHDPVARRTVVAVLVLTMLVFAGIAWGVLALMFKTGGAA